MNGVQAIMKDTKAGQHAFEAVHEVSKKKEISDSEFYSESSSLATVDFMNNKLHPTLAPVSSTFKKSNSKHSNEDKSGGAYMKPVNCSPSR